MADIDDAEVSRMLAEVGRSIAIKDLSSKKKLFQRLLDRLGHVSPERLSAERREGLRRRVAVCAFSLVMVQPAVLNCLSPLNSPGPVYDKVRLNELEGLLMLGRQEVERYTAEAAGKKPKGEG